MLTGNSVPGHYDVDGNKLVDDYVKRAATGDCSHPSEPPAFLRHRLPASAAALWQTFFCTSLWQDADRLWAESQRFPTVTLSLDFKMRQPRKYVMKILSTLSRAQASLLVHLHTGHAPLNKRLFQLGKVDSPSALSARTTPRLFIITF